MKRVLVTAMNSPLDQQLALQLVAENFIVRIIGSETDAGSPLLRLPLEIFPGHLSDAEAVKQAIKGCDYIIQTTPVIPGKNELQYQEHRLKQTINLLDAAKQSQVKTFLHLYPLSLNDHLRQYSLETYTNLSKAIKLPMYTLPAEQQLLLKHKSVFIKKVLVQLGHTSPVTMAGNSHTNSLQDAVMAIVKVLFTGEHSRTYIMGEIPSPPVSVQQRMLWATGIPVTMLKNIVGFVRTGIESRLQIWAKLLGLIAWSQCDWLAALYHL